MKIDYEDRVTKIADYIIENSCTIRKASQHFNLSKTYVHHELTKRLPTVNSGLFREVQMVLNQNKSERHIRGGIATQMKYERLRDKENAANGVHAPVNGKLTVK